MKRWIWNSWFSSIIGKKKQKEHAIYEVVLNDDGHIKFVNVHGRTKSKEPKEMLQKKRKVKMKLKKKRVQSVEQKEEKITSTCL